MGYSKNRPFVKVDVTGEVDKHFDELAADLNTKRDKTVDIQMNELSQEVKEGMTGGAVPVVGVDAVDTENIKDKSVTPELTSFARNSKNLFNKETAVLNKDLDLTGNVVDGTWLVSDYIAVETSAIYNRSHLSKVSSYDSNKQFVKHDPADTTPLTMVSTVKFVRISTRINFGELYQFEKGSTKTEYESYGLKIPDYEGGASIEQVSDISAAKISSIYPNKGDYPDKIYELLPNIEDTQINLGSAIKDFNRSWRDNLYGIKIVTSGAATVDLNTTFPTPKNIPHVQSLGMWVYIEDSAMVDLIVLELGHESTGGHQWSRSDSSFSNGWNLLRWKSIGGVIGNWEIFYRLRVIIVTTGSARITIGSIFMEQPNKAKLLFVEDGGYVEFLSLGYPELKARGIPTTWALTPGRLGEGRVITETDVDTLALDYMSSFSFHSWASEVHSTMTREEVADNAIKSVRWLRRKGLKPDHLYRAAITQNNAPEHEVLQEIVEAYSSTDGGSALEIFPFSLPFGTPRITLHGKTPAQMDALFEDMKKTHSLMIGYTHGISDNPVPDISLAEWDYFLQKIDQAQLEGWLEGVTYEMLRNRYSKPSDGWGIEKLINAT